MRRPWLAFVASAWLESMNGSTYIFGSYSQALKLALNLDQKSLDTVGFFNSMGSSCGVGPSLLYSHIPAWSIVFLGLLQSSCGCFFTWIAVIYPSSFRLWQLCVFQFLVGNAQTYIQTAALVTGLKIFPRSRGFVVGYLKGFLALSGSILLQFSMLICNGDEICLPLLLTWLLPALSAIPMLALGLSGVPDQADDHEEEDQQQVSSRFNALTAILVVLGIYLSVVLLLQGSSSLSRGGTAIVVTGMCVILLSLIFVLLKSEEPRKQFEASGHGLLQDDQDHAAEALEQAPPQLQPGVQEQAQDAQTVPVIRIGDEFTLQQAMASLDFWLLFLVMVLGSSSTAAINGNLSQLGHSLGYSSRAITICISLFSICSCFGRIGSGIASEHFLHTNGTSRLVFLLAAMLILSLSLLNAAIALPGCLYTISILSGAAEGTLWCVAIAIASELFGLSSFGSIFNIIAFACPIGQFPLSVLLVGSLYDAQAGDRLLCDGPRCFRGPFLLLGACSLIAALVSTLILHRSREFYSKQKKIFLLD